MLKATDVLREIKPSSENESVFVQNSAQSLCPLFFVKVLFFHQMIALQKV